MRFKSFAYRVQPTRPSTDAVLAVSSRLKQSRALINSTEQPTTICETVSSMLRFGLMTIFTLRPQHFGRMILGPRWADRLQFLARITERTRRLFFSRTRDSA